MKFAEHLAAHITPEWRKQYISYEEMKVNYFLTLLNNYFVVIRSYFNQSVSHYLFL